MEYYTLDILGTPGTMELWPTLRGSRWQFDVGKSHIVTVVVAATWFYIGNLVCWTIESLGLQRLCGTMTVSNNICLNYESGLWQTRLLLMSFNVEYVINSKNKNSMLTKLCNLMKETKHSIIHLQIYL